MQRSQLSRLENSDERGPSLRTLSLIADRLGMRLMIRFVAGNETSEFRQSELRMGDEIVDL